MPWEVSPYLQGGPGQQAFEIGGSEHDERGVAGECGVVGVAINVPNVTMAVPDHSPPCQVDWWHQLAVDLARLADIWYTGGTVYDLVIRVGGTPGALLAKLSANNVSQCVFLMAKIPKGMRLTRIQTTVSTNGVPGSAAIFRVHPSLDLWNRTSRSWQRISSLAESACASYPGYDGTANTHCSFDVPVTYDGSGKVVHPTDPSAEAVGVVFKNWSHDRHRTPFLRAYYARPDSAETYVVKQCDTLWRIAAKELGDPKRYVDIIAANSDQLANPDLLKIGQVLKLPRTSGKP